MSTKAEFDAYAAGYTGGMDNPLKRFVGASPEQFLDVKARWLLDDCGGPPASTAARAVFPPCSITVVASAACCGC